MDSLVIGAVTKYTYKDIAPWLKSLQATGYKGQIALIAYDMKAEDAQKLDQEGVHHVFAFQKDEHGNLTYKDTAAFNICVERFAHLWYFLDNVENDFKYVVMTDVKDVIFQSNPIEWLERQDDDETVYLGSENLKYEDEPWGRNNMRYAFGPMMYEIVKEKSISCAGVIAGGRDYVKDLALQIFLLCRGTNSFVEGGGGPDQAALNLLRNLKPTSDHIKSLSTYCDFVCHAGTSMHAIKAGSGAIGAAIKDNPNLINEIEEKLLYPDIKFVDGKVCTADGHPYSIVHQYDRVPEWKKHFHDKFGVTE